MAITVLKKRQKKALAIAFLTLAFVGLIIPTAVHYTIDFIKSITKETVVWKINNETDVSAVVFAYYNGSIWIYDDQVFAYDDVEDVVVVSVSATDTVDDAYSTYISVELPFNFTYAIENYDFDTIEVTVSADVNITDVSIELAKSTGGSSIKTLGTINVTSEGSTFRYDFALSELLNIKSNYGSYSMMVRFVEVANNGLSWDQHTVLFQIKLVKHEAVDHELWKNVLIGGSGILMFFAGVFALPNVSLAEFDRLLRRKRARRAMAGSVLALALVGLTIAIVYYLSGSILMTIMGFFVGVLGYYAFASGRKLSGSKAGATGWLGSMFGAVCDHFTQMQNTIISGVQQGDIACIMWLIGYVWLLLVLIYNFVTTGRVWR